MGTYEKLTLALFLPSAIRPYTPAPLAILLRASIFLVCVPAKLGASVCSADPRDDDGRHYHLLSLASGRV